MLLRQLGAGVIPSSNIILCNVNFCGVVPALHTSPSIRFLVPILGRPGFYLLYSTIDAAIISITAVACRAYAV